MVGTSSISVFSMRCLALGDTGRPRCNPGEFRGSLFGDVVQDGAQAERGRFCAWCRDLRRGHAGSGRKQAEKLPCSGKIWFCGGTSSVFPGSFPGVTAVAPAKGRPNLLTLVFSGRWAAGRRRCSRNNVADIGRCDVHLLGGRTFRSGINLPGCVVIGFRVVCPDYGGLYKRRRRLFFQKLCRGGLGRLCGWTRRRYSIRSGFQSHEDTKDVLSQYAGC